MAVLENPDNKHLPITAEQAKAYLRQQVWASDPALQLTIRDSEQAENWQNSKAFVRAWEASDALYQSPPSSNTWAGTQTASASVNLHTVSTTVNSLVPQILSGLFADNPPFMIAEQGDTTDKTARAISAILAYQLEDIDFRTEIELGTTNTSLYGTQVYKWGWEKFTKQRKIYKRKNPEVTLPGTIPGADPTVISSDEFEETLIDEVTERPRFEHVVNLRHILVDPSLNVPDIRKAKYVIHRMYMTWDDLDKLRDRPGYDIPSREELLELFLPPMEPVETDPNSEPSQSPLWDSRSAPQYDESTSNPFEKPLEVLERWDKNTCIVVLNKKLVICNEENPYGKIPYFSVNWENIPGGFWGMGLGQIIGVEQRLQQGIINLSLDQMALMLNTPLVRVRGKSIPTQNIRIGPGRIIEVDTKGDIEPLGRYAPVPEAMSHIQMSQSRAEQASGANDITSMGQAGGSGHSNIARSAAGANALAAGANNRTSAFIDRLATQVIVPFLYEMYEMDRALLPPSQVRYILNDELKHEYLRTGGDIMDILNARLKFNVLAGSKMIAKQRMAQALPSLITFLTNPETTQQLAISNKKVDVVELVQMSFTIADWSNEKDVILDMTPQDEQRQQQLQQGAQQSKLQGQAALQQQKQQAEQELADQNNTARAARDILREQYKASVENKPIPGAATSF